MEPDVLPLALENDQVRTLIIFAIVIDMMHNRPRWQRLPERASAYDPMETHTIFAVLSPDNAVDIALSV